jgi:uncharacterized protein
VRRIALVLGIAAVALVATALPAAAHVTIQPGSAAKGGFATVAFQVPNEDPESKTVKLVVQFPPDSPIPFVSVEPVPGWTSEIAKKELNPPIESHGEQITEAVESITWTAASGGGIGDGEFIRFPVSMGTLPEDVDELAFPSIQTYANGDEVEWIQETPAGGEEPERPVPVLTLEEGDHEEEGGETEGTTATTTAPAENGGGGVAAAAATSQAVQDAEDSADTAKTLAIVALIVGIIGIGVGIGGLVVARRRA